MVEPTEREQQLYTMLQEQRQLIESLTGTMTALQAQVANPPSALPPLRRDNIVDTRMLGKPDHFNGQHWRDWSTVFKAYTAATDPRLGVAMIAAEDRDSSVLNATLSTEQAALSTQLYYMLIMLCKEGALIRVVNAGPNEGLEAWRLTVRHHEPVSQTRSAGLLQELLNYDFDGDITSRLQAFDRDCNRYTTSSKEPFGDNIKIGILLRKLPEGSLKSHLILNSQRLSTWEAVKLEVDNVRRAQLATASASVPMDVDVLHQDYGSSWYSPPPPEATMEALADIAEQISALAKGKKGFGKGKKGGKDNKLPTTPCPKCGKMGHWGKSCATKGGKTGDGKGSGSNYSGKAPVIIPSIQCWKCGEKGHPQSKCPQRPSRLHDVAEDTPGATGSAEPGSLQDLGVDLGALFINDLALESVGTVAATPASRRRIVSFGVDSCAAASEVPLATCSDYPLIQQ